MARDQPEWATAEDAFLSGIARVVDLGYGVRISSDQRMRRFNSLRIHDLDALDRSGWRAVLDAQTPVFHAVQMPLTVQLAAPATASALPGRWRRVGPRLVHVATDLADLREVSEVAVRLEPVSGAAAFDAFVSLLLPDRVPAHLRTEARPMMEVATRRALAGPDSHGFLAYDGDTLAGQVICSAAPGGWAVSGLTVPEAMRGRGYMKAIYAAVAQRFSGQLYGQIIEGVATLAYRDRFPSTRHLAVTQTFQREDDPFAEPAAAAAA